MRGITTLYHLTQPETSLRRIHVILRSPLLLRVASLRLASPRSSWFTRAAFAATKRIHISQSRSRCTHRAVLRSFSIQTSRGRVECRPTRCRSCRSLLSSLTDQKIYKSPSLHFSDLSLLPKLSYSTTAPPSPLFHLRRPSPTNFIILSVAVLHSAISISVNSGLLSGRPV